MAVNKCSLDNMLRSVLSVGNSESNQSYPASIYESQFNAATSMLLDALVAAYPKERSVVEMLEPYTVTDKIKNDRGYISLPDNFRNLLGLSISVRPDGSDCGEINPSIATPTGFDNSTLKSGCQSRPVRIVPKSEWDELTTSLYKFPTHDEPIGLYYGNKKIKVCPYDIATVEVMYVRQEKMYRYGYIMQPDDTYIFDPSTSEESEWTSAAYTPLFKALISLYGAYTRDNDVRDWSMILSQKGIL